MKKRSKRRAWSTADVRTLKAAAKNEDQCRQPCPILEKNRRGDTPEGFQSWVIARLARLN